MGIDIAKEFELVQKEVIETITNFHIERREKRNVQKPLVSLIVPSFNQGVFLERTLISLLNQTYPNIEYIIIDGGSTDNTTQIIKKYEKFITYWVSEKDNGQSDAINKGLRVAKGKYVNWIGSDDILLPSAVDVMVDVLEKDNNVGLVYGACVFIDENDKILKKYSFPDMTLENFLYKKHSTIAQPSSLMRMDLVKEVGFLDTNLHYCMDYDLWIKLIKKSRFANLGEKILSGCRLHNSSKTVGSFNKMALEKIKVNRRYSGNIINKVIYKNYWYMFENFLRRFRKKKR